MFTLLIAEDNQNLRLSIKENIPWEENGIEVIGTADNGEEALEVITKQPPDILITDIVMPFVSGLELIEKAIELNQNIKIIIISAYDQFEYAQKALKYHVYDYILKPVDYDYLLQTVKNVSAEMLHENELRNQLKKSLPVLRENFILQLLEGNYNNDTLLEDIKYLEIDFKYAYYQCVLFEIDNSVQLNRELKFEGYNICLLKLIEEINSSLSNILVSTVRTKGNCIAAVLGCNEPDSTDSSSTIYEKIAEIRNTLTKDRVISLSIGLGNAVTGYQQLQHSYLNAQDALDARLILGCNQIIDINNITFSDAKRFFHFPMSIEESLIKKIKLGSKQEIGTAFFELEKYFADNSMDTEYVKIIVIVLISKIFQVIYELGIDDKRISELKLETLYNIQELFDSKEIVRLFKDLLFKICDIINDYQLIKHKQLISKVKNFLELSYGNCELSLNEIASSVALSPNYLCTIFKKEEGINLNEYITKIRIDIAKELLRTTDLKNYEVALRVGYSNPYYFSACFKKNTGLSPNDFKKQLFNYGVKNEN